MTAETEEPEAAGNHCAYSVRQNLQDAGCTEEMVEEFIQAGKKEQQIQLLAVQRRRLLEELHRAEKRIDCLDYLIYRMQT